MKKILVTGSDGYIGSVLVELLVKNGYQVTGMDCLFFKGITLGEYNFSYNLIEKDTRASQHVNLSEFDTLIHLAALSNDPLGQINPKLTQDINFVSTIKLAKLAKKAGVKRFIFSSSCSIYGITDQEIVDETSQVKPLTEYAISKINSEKALIDLSDDNFCVVILRNATVYGYSPKFRDDLVVNNLVCCAHTLNQIKIKSDGSPWRPLIDVRDLAEIFLQFINLDSTLINAGIFNIGFNENNFQIRDIANMIKKLLPKSKIIYTKEHGKDTRSYRVNFDKFRRLLPNFRQSWPLSKSMTDLIDKLTKFGYKPQDMSDGKFTRLSVLTNLIKNGYINKQLFWIKH